MAATKTRKEILEAMNKASKKLESRPKLPFCVRDDNGDSWSSHLVHHDAMKHLQLARKMGIKNPTVTDGRGQDITPIVDGWINGKPIE